MSRKVTTYDFVNRAKIAHNNKYNYSKVDYINNSTKVCIICPEHGEFWQTPNSHLRGKGCPFCKREKLRSDRRISLEEFIIRAKGIFNNKYDYSLVEIKNVMTKVKIICPTHGVFEQIPLSHLKGHGCPKCGFEIMGKGERLKQEDFILRSIIVHGDKYNYERASYKGMHEKVNIICRKHGVFSQTPASHLSGKGCPKCSASHGELKVEEFLKQNNIEYQSQYPIKLEQQMFSRNNLKIDFYLPRHNTFIEFNGIQHYEFTPAFHKTEEDFNKQVERDKRLKQYCKDNKIKLIVIKYNQIDKIEDILNKKLKI